MSAPLIELESFENQNNSLNFYSDEKDFSKISRISKSKFSSHYHFLCKKCNRIPTIEFYKKSKIKYTCKCKESPRELLIKDIYDYLFYSNNIDLENENLKCYLHPDEKYSLYCIKCKKNLCSKCAAEDCIDHKEKIKVFALDKNVINKCKYIIKTINEKINHYIDDSSKNFDLDDDNEDNISNYKLAQEQNNTDPHHIDSDDNLINTDNNITKDNDNIIIQKKNDNIITINTDEKEELINIMKGNNDEELYDENIFI